MARQDQTASEQEKLGRENGFSKLSGRDNFDVEKQSEEDKTRLVKKNGACNVLHTNVPRKSDYLRDGFTTLIDLQWRWVLLIFSFTYVIGWVVFAGFWYALAWDHGDIDYRQRDTEWEPCVANVDNFRGAFLFSVETQTTIGYGFRSVTEACWIGGLMVVVQSVFSCLVDVVMTGCIFVKLARPKKRAATIKFSDHACIAERGGKLCFMFRVGNIRQSHMYDVKIRAQLIIPRFTSESKCTQIETFELTFKNNVFLILPMVIVHEIDESGPLYHLSANMMAKKACDKFEIIVFLEGVLEQTGLMMQARTSYLRDEIHTDSIFREFTPPDENQNVNQKRLTVDYRKFNCMYKVERTLTADLSAGERNAPHHKIYYESKCPCKACF